MYPVSQQFNVALTEPVRDVKVRVVLLDSSFVQIDDISDVVIEGVVYVDAERAMRRTAQIRIINENGAYTPKGADVDQHGTNSYFWWNKLFRLYWGLKTGSEYEYVLLGTFMVDKFDVLVERGISVLNVDGSDLWRRLSDSEVGSPDTWAKGTNLNTIIKDIADDAGITKYNLDPMDDRAAADKLCQVRIFLEAGDNRGEKLRELCKDWGLDIYFDIWGRLTTEDQKALENTIRAAPVWTFRADEESLIVNISKSRTSDGLKNHIIVTGERDDGTALVRAEAIDGAGTTTSSIYYTNSGGPATVEQIGDRVEHIRSTTIASTAKALILAKRELLKAQVAEEQVRMPIITVPMFEAGDVIRIVDPLSATNDRYFLNAFDIPLRSGAQELFVKKVKGVW